MDDRVPKFDASGLVDRKKRRCCLCMEWVKDDQLCHCDAIRGAHCYGCHLPAIVLSWLPARSCGVSAPVIAADLANRAGLELSASEVRAVLTAIGDRFGIAVGQKSQRGSGDDMGKGRHLQYWASAKNPNVARVVRHVVMT